MIRTMEPFARVALEVGGTEMRGCSGRPVCSSRDGNRAPDRSVSWANEFDVGDSAFNAGLSDNRFNLDLSGSCVVGSDVILSHVGIITSTDDRVNSRDDRVLVDADVFIEFDIRNHFVQLAAVNDEFVAGNCHDETVLQGLLALFV